MQKELNGHMASLNRCLNIGRTWNHKKRIFESTPRNFNLIPPGYILNKDHKQIELGTLPGSRLVVSNCRGMGEPLSTLLSNLVESLAQGLEDRFQVVSTEDLIAKFKDYNATVDKEEEEDGSPIHPPQVPCHAAPTKAGCPTQPPPILQRPKGHRLNGR